MSSGWCRPDDRVAYVTIPAGDTPPPDSVSAAVGALMVQALAASASAPGEVQSAGPAQTRTLGTADSASTAGTP
jgi:hypothetical protein